MEQQQVVLAGAGQATGREKLCKGLHPRLLPALRVGVREPPTSAALNLLPKQSQVLLLVEGREQGRREGLAAPSIPPTQPITRAAEIPFSMCQEPLARNEPKSSF